MNDRFQGNKLAVIVVIDPIDALLEFRPAHTLRQRQGCKQK